MITTARLQVVEADAREVAGDDVARALCFLEGEEIFTGLVERSIQVFARAFVFNDELARDEAVDEALRAAEFFHRLFVDGGALRTDAEAFVKT